MREKENKEGNATLLNTRVVDGWGMIGCCECGKYRLSGPWYRYNMFLILH